jgi:hypothetical protein
LSAIRSSSRAAELIAKAVIDEAAASSSSRRLYLGEHLGVEPFEVFEKLASDCNAEVTIRGQQLSAYALERPGAGAVLVIPYLVTDSSSAGRNQGSEGFAALLRNAFLEGGDDEIRVLMILAKNPVDTVMTAAENMANSTSLSAAALIARATTSRNETDASQLLRHVATDAPRWLIPDRAILDTVLDFLSEPWGSPADVGASLYELPFYVKDSAASDRARLSKAASWRRKLERWAMPGEDFADRVRRELRADPATAEVVAASKAPFGIDFSTFELDDLERAAGAGRAPSSYRLPLEVGGARASLARGHSLAVWLDRAGDVTLRLAGDLHGELIASVNWPDGRRSEAEVDAGDRVVRLGIQQPGWSFGELRTSIGGRALSAVRIASYLSVGTWFPVEDRLEFDIRRGAFAVEGDAAISAVAPGGRLSPMAARISPGTAGEVVMAQVERGGESHTIPLLISGEDVDGGSERDTDRSELDRPVASPVHAQIAAAADGDFRAGAFGLDEGGASVVIGSARYLIDPRGDRGTALYALEAELLRRPEALTFVRGPSGITPDPYFERIPFSVTPRDSVERFMAARRALFTALAPAGSAYAVATGIGRNEAIEYVGAYADLLERMEKAGPYRREYDRLLLIDAVTVAETGEVLLAPTNPVTLAFYLAFAAAAENWIADGSVPPADADLASITPRHLLPLVAVRDAWYESAPGPGFLWRSFRQLRAQEVAEHEPGFIEKRIRFFLDVHPDYKDPRQTLSIAFFQPGDGKVMREALRLFYEPDASVETEADYRRPKLHLHLFTPGGTRPEAIDELLRKDELKEAEEVVRSRVTVTIHELDAKRDGAFFHLAFVFRAPVQRGVRSWDMQQRASTTYVGGLATVPGRLMMRDAAELTYAWGTFAAQMCGDAGAGDAGTLLGRVMRPTLELVGGQPRERLERFVTRMASSSATHDAPLYEQAVWVVHLDRLLGLEAVGSGAGPVYLIDYEEQTNPASPGYDAITATYYVDPYRAAISSALRGIGRVQRPGVDAILRRLNCVSGSWALELLRRPPHLVAERIGTVAAIAVLDDVDRTFASADGLAALLPLPEVFRVLEERGIAAPAAPAGDDLVLFWVSLDEVGRLSVTARIIEVKYTGSSSSAGPDLQRARRELVSTAAHLLQVFEETGSSSLFRARDLAELIRAGALRRAAFDDPARGTSPQIEAALQRIASGDFSFRTSYWIGGQRIEGDVLWIDARRLAQVERRELPGSGATLGMIHAGRPALERLAEGKVLVRPSGWLSPRYEAPPTGVTPAKPPAAPAPPPAPPVSVPAREDDPELDAEKRTRATELTQAAMKYELELEAFSPEEVQVGPTVLRFRTRPLGRQSLAGVQRRALDLGREVGSAEGVIVGQEPYFITIDIPRRKPELIHFTDYAGELEEPGLPGCLRFLVGMAPLGEVKVADLARLPHLLVAGATGSGKSVFLRTLVTSLVRTRSPETLRLLVIDPKQVDYAAFEQLPHLAGGRIVTDPAEAIVVLAEMIQSEIERRRPVLKRSGATSATDFYEAGGSLEELPQMVVVVDEFADLVATLGRAQRASFLTLIQRYGQLTRAFGIYLVLATQRPSVQVITGDIKANLTARVALKLLTAQDSLTILGHGGAENLREHGDLLFSHGGRVEHLQGFLTTSSEARSAGDAWID